MKSEAAETLELMRAMVKLLSDISADLRWFRDREQRKAAEAQHLLERLPRFP